MRPVVNVAVCGDFKQLQLIPHLAKLIEFGRVYYASRLSNNAAALGLNDVQACNFFLKEYLVQFHARYLQHAAASLFYPMYDRIWQSSVLRSWRPCDVLYAVLQGKTLEIMRKAKQENSRVLGHPIVCHPNFFNEQLNIELDRLSLPAAPFLGNDEALLAEIALCDRIFCLSGLVRDSFVSAGYPAGMIDVIPLPTDLETFVPAEPVASNAPFRVVCVAEISPIKGHIYLLEAWRKLAPANAELIFAGTMRREMVAVLNKYRGLFRYAGPLDKSSLVELYQQSSLLVLPSVQDGFGFVVSEALACGIPVLVTDHVGARDIVRSGENGFVVPPRDVAALADVIGRIRSSQQLQRRLREGAIASRDSFPTMEDTAQRIANSCNQAALAK
jgi:glycosyltransferase involved in cell wall biosynthesis